MKSIIPIIAFIIVFCSTGKGQETFQSVIQTTYNRTAMQEIMPLPDGSFYTKEVLIGSDYLYSGVQVTKFNACHNKVWSRVINHNVGSWFKGPGQNHGCIALNDKSLIVSTITVTVIKGYTGIFPMICKIDTNGNVLWSKIIYHDVFVTGYNTTQNTSSSCVATNDGGFVMSFCGSASISGLGSYVMMMKFDKDGVLLFSNGIDFSKIGGTGIIADILKMPDKGFCLIISEGFTGINAVFPILIRTDSTGNVLWTKKMNNPKAFIDPDFSIRGCVADSKGNLYAIGSFNDYRYPYKIQRSFIFKINADGEPGWFQTLNYGAENITLDVFTRMAINGDDHIAVMVNLNNLDNYFTQFDTSGNLLMAKHIKNKCPYIEYFPSYTYSKPVAETVDSDFMFIEKYYATNASIISRFDKKGKSSCFDKDTVFNFLKDTLTASDYYPNPLPGFRVADTAFTLSDQFIKQKMLCNSHLYPIADLGNDTVICADKYILHSGPENAGARFLWSTGDTSADLTVLKSSTYWIRITSDFCTSTDTVKVFLLNKINTGLVKNYTLCRQDSVFLQVKDTAIPGFYWVTPSKDAAGNPIIVQGNAVWARDSGFYYLKQKAAHCTNVDTVRVNYYPGPAISHDTVVCSGSTDTLFAGIATKAAHHLWSTGDTSLFIVVHKTGKYWLKLTYNTCTSTDTVKVVFKDQVKISLAKKQIICPYDSIVLEVKDNSSDLYWVTPKQKIINGSKLTAHDSGNYILKLKGTKNCPVLDTIHVGISPLPNAIAGPDTILCHNQVYTMQGAGGITYLWTPADYLSSATDPNAKAVLPNTQKYTLIVSNKQGCRDTSRVMLNVRPQLQLKAFANNASICFGQRISLWAKAHGGDSLHYKFNWPYDSLPGDSISLKLYKSSWHKVVINDNCTPAPISDSVYVNVIPAARADFSFIPGSLVKTNHQVIFKNKSLNASSYYWTFGTKDNSSIVSPVYIFTDTGNYKITLVAYGLSGCPNDTSYGFIKVIEGNIAIYIPNVFKPDGDGRNDFFEISGTGITGYTYDIYNRWGEQIYHKNNGQAGWDGSFKNQPVMEGVYLYQLDVTDIDGTHHYLGGTVTLIR